MTSSFCFLTPMLVRLGNSTNKFTLALTLAQLRRVWFLVSMSSWSSLPTAVAKEKTISLTKKFSRKDRNEIHAIAVVVYSSELNMRFHFSILIGYDQLWWLMWKANFDNRWTKYSNCVDLISTYQLLSKLILHSPFSLHCLEINLLKPWIFVHS